MKTFSNLLLALFALAGSAFAASYMDVAYRDLPGVEARRVSLDLYVPDGARNAPVVVFVHGGGWRRGDKRTGAGGKSEAFLARGIAFASVNYRLHPNASPGDMADDVAASLAFLRANATRYGLDPDRLAVMGHSAGAHLAALTAADQSGLERAGVPSSSVKAVILLDGAGYDVARQVADGRNARLYREVFGENPDDLARWSPVVQARLAKALPEFLIAYVDRRDAVLQAQWMAEAVRVGGGASTLLLAEGETHASINRGFGDPGDATTVVAFSLLERAFR
jgi:acetyl esterase/lipase